MSARRVLIIGQGIAGVYASGVDESGNEWRGSGYRHADIDAYARDETRDGSIEGALCIDKRPAIETHGAGVVFRSPMPSMRGEHRPFNIKPGESMIADAVAGDPGNGFGSLVRGAWGGSVSLDEVPLGDYARYWRIHGARVGYVVGGVVVWDTPPQRPEEPQPVQGDLL